VAPNLAIPLWLKPMEAEPVDDLPPGKGWLYEPKYDGFRCLAFCDEGKIDLRSKKQKSLNHFLPEVMARTMCKKPAKAAGFVSPALATPAKRIPAARAP
jgi:ATP-dependent DNA ligase